MPRQYLLRSRFKGVRGIVDPTNFGWPREVEGLNGLVSIPAKPQRIITASVGHDEMTLALVPGDRLVAVGSASKNAIYSNVASLVQDKVQISRDPETIIAQAPDVVVTSPFFSAEGVDALVAYRHPSDPDRAEARPRGANQQHPADGLHLRRGGARPRVRDRGSRPIRGPGER